MIIHLELLSGSNRCCPTKREIQKNIDALDRVIQGAPLCGDDISLMDTKSILEGIQTQLPGDMKL